jgi:hypothetical protein
MNIQASKTTRKNAHFLRSAECLIGYVILWINYLLNYSIHKNIFKDKKLINLVENKFIMKMKGRLNERMERG